MHRTSVQAQAFTPSGKTASVHSLYTCFFNYISLLQGTFFFSLYVHHVSLPCGHSIFESTENSSDFLNRKQFCSFIQYSQSLYGLAGFLPVAHQRWEGEREKESDENHGMPFSKGYVILRRYIWFERAYFL